MNGKRFSYGQQNISKEDVEAVVTALGEELLTGGKAVAAFEASLQSACGARHAVACASGTAALHLAALALDLKKTDAVIVPAITFVATANCIRFVGAEVVFADVDSETGLITTDGLTDAVRRSVAAGLSPRAVIPVHYAGQVADISRVAQNMGIAVIEDAAHALGSMYSNDTGKRTVGDCRDSMMTIFSFHPVKTITTGEGGAVLTNDEILASRLKKLRNHGITREPGDFEFQDQALAPCGDINPWYHEMNELGFNYRLTDIQAALGSSQLKRLPEFVAYRRSLIEAYDSQLKPTSSLLRPLGRIDSCKPSWHLSVLLIDFAAVGTDRATVMKRLSASGIGTQVHYLPVYRQPYYENRYGKMRLPGAELFYERALSVPLFYGLTADDVGEVVTELRYALGAK